MKILKKVILTVILAIITILMMTVITKAATVKVTGDTLNIRKGPSTDTEIIAMLSKNVECEMLGEEGDWYKIKYKNYTGYISKQYAELVEEDSNQEEISQENENSQENESEQETENNQEENQSTQTDENTEQTQKSGEKTEIKITYKKFNKNADIKILPLIYASKIGSSKKNQEVLVVTETSGWSYIQTDTISGWVRSDTLGEEKTVTTSNSENTTDNSSTDNSTDEKIAYINEEYVNLRKGAGTNYNIIKILTLNAQVTILDEEGTWYKVKSGSDTGYVSKDYVSESKTVTTRSNVTPRTEDTDETIIGATDGEDIEEVKKQTEKENTSENKNNSTNTNNFTDSKEDTNSTQKENNTTKGTDIIAYAKKYLGHKYVYGGDGSNGTFDCSGFTMYVYKHFGISLPHGATSQYKSGKGTKISKQSDLQTGDIVFLTDYETGVGIGHCGIYIGNGNFIHASTTTYTVTISSLNTTYSGRFYAGLRLI